MDGDPLSAPLSIRFFRKTLRWLARYSQDLDFLKHWKGSIAAEGGLREISIEEDLHCYRGLSHYSGPCQIDYLESVFAHQLALTGLPF
jgi:hypothetical protein